MGHREAQLSLQAGETAVLSGSSNEGRSLMVVPVLDIFSVRFIYIKPKNSDDLDGILSFSLT